MNRETIEHLDMVASKANASQLDTVCKHFERNVDFWDGSSLFDNVSTNINDCVKRQLSIDLGEDTLFSSDKGTKK